MISVCNSNGDVKIAIRLPGSIVFIPMHKIVRLQAYSSYTKIYLDHPPNITTSNVLKEYETILVAHGFIRTHRSHLVNMFRIAAINKSGDVVMDDSSKAAISKRKRSAVLKKLNTFS